MASALLLQCSTPGTQMSWGRLLHKPEFLGDFIFTTGQLGFINAMIIHTFIVQYVAKSSSPVNPDQNFTVC